MKNNKLDLFYMGLMILGAAARIIPHPPNFTPTGALAFFSGSKINGWRAYLIPLGILALADAWIGWHSALPFVYASFLLTTWLGRSLGQSWSGRLAGLGLSSVIFFIVTNFGVWALSGMYPLSPAGLSACYLAALPFFRNEIAANFLYGAAFYAAASLVEKKYQTQGATA